MASSTRAALLEQGALLFARRGVDGVTTRELHEAIGARNESALHYHFGGRTGLVDEILRLHLEAIETRRAPVVAAIVADHREQDVRALIHALAAPMAADLDTEVGRAHLRLVAQLNHPAQGYGRQFKISEAPAGRAVVRWLFSALSSLPDVIRAERLAALRSQLLSLFGMRVLVIDEPPVDVEVSSNELFLDNLVDQLVAGLLVAPSDATMRAVSSRGSNGYH